MVTSKKLKKESEQTVSIQPREQKKPLLMEIAWEVCNQVGGIYTVIRSKVPSMVEEWGENYCLIGPYFQNTAMVEFEPIEDLEESYFGRIVKRMQEMGYEVHYGRWLVTGKPKIVLLDFKNQLYKSNDLKHALWNKHQISTLNAEPLVDQVIVLGEMIRVFLTEFGETYGHKNDVIAHFHEWMVAPALIDIRTDNVPISTVFTTHATMLGRYIAGNEPDFYEKLRYYNWEYEAQHYGVEAQAKIERFAAQKCHVLTTVSDVTAKECEVFFGRTCDLILPNGLNVTRFAATHEFQNLHLKYKEKIHQFVMGHFFQSYSWDLDNTLYFFTSGRYEFRNKGYDLTLEALKRLNFKIVQAGLDTTIVMFIITKSGIFY